MESNGQQQNAVQTGNENSTIFLTASVGSIGREGEISSTGVGALDFLLTEAECNIIAFMAGRRLLPTCMWLL